MLACLLHPGHAMGIRDLVNDREKHVMGILLAIPDFYVADPGFLAAIIISFFTPGLLNILEITVYNTAPNLLVSHCREIALSKYKDFLGAHWLTFSQSTKVFYHTILIVLW